jgi:cytochrome b6
MDATTSRGETWGDRRRALWPAIAWRSRTGTSSCSGPDGEDLSSTAAGPGWLESRLPLRAALGAFLGKPVPIHRLSAAYLLGGASLFLLGAQAATGILISLYYQPTPEAAHASVARLMTDVPYGWLFRSLHARGADLLVAVLAAHVLTTFFMRAYRPPRELTWVTGFVVASLVLALCFSGSLLPWDTLAYFATQVGSQEVGTLPLVGPGLVRLVRGGEGIGAHTLTRFHVAHVVLLPLGLIALLGLHLYLVQAHGISVPEPLAAPAPAAARAVPFFPLVALADAVVWLVLLGALAGLTALAPAGLGPAADPLAPAPAGIRPEWYFAPFYESLRLAPSRLLGLEGAAVANIGFALLALLWLTVPFWDTPGRTARARAATGLGLATLTWALALSAYSYWRSWPGG